MRETNRTIRELKEEIAHLRSFISEIHELSAELVDGDADENHDAADNIRGELERLRELVSRDELTQVLNRRGFYERFVKLFNEALYLKSHPTSQRRLQVHDFALIFIDLDNFKQINDTYGHDAGDVVLKEAAAFFKAHIRDIDGVARFGGEEFVLVLVGATEELAFQKAEVIREQLSSVVHVPNTPDHVVTASIGVVSLGLSDADDLDELVGYADKAMYEAKTERGKDAVVRYSELSKEA